MPHPLTKKAAGRQLMLAMPFIGCRLMNIGTQFVNTSTNTAVTWNTEGTPVGSLPGFCFKSDPSMHSLLVNTSRIYVPDGMAGVWEGIAGIGFDNNVGGGIRQMFWRINGTTVVPGTINNILGSSTYGFRLQAHLAPVLLNAGDYMEIIAFDDGSTGSTIGSATAYPGTASTNIVTFKRAGTLMNR